MNNRAIFFEVRIFNFHLGKYFLHMNVGSESESTDPTILFKKYFPQCKLPM